ncbi:mitochondrial aldehyde dehydrogenase [Exophiala xenobiotica]|nr:mitochondrial aldehyde dehydrogenase [Exophiala xenobiotica]
MAAWKLGPALACGNTVVLKAAEQTPLSVLYLATLIKEAGFPAGVVNIINGYGSSAGAGIAGHMGIDKVAFTGSTNTGKAIMMAAATNLKIITLETGGKSPFLVFDDANLDQAVKWAHVGIMSNMGQICTATSRIYVQDAVYDDFVQKFKEYTIANTKLGNQFDPESTHGPQVSANQLKRILSYVGSAKSEGAELVLGGVAGSGKGYFIEPTIFKDVHNNMKVVREEIFGPFAVIQSFKTEEEVVEKANDTEYGLGHKDKAMRDRTMLQRGRNPSLQLWIPALKSDQFGRRLRMQQEELYHPRWLFPEPWLESMASILEQVFGK